MKLVIIGYCKARARTEARNYIYLNCIYHCCVENFNDKLSKNFKL